MRFGFIFNIYRVLSDMDMFLTCSMFIYIIKQCACAIFTQEVDIIPGKGIELWFSLKNLIFAPPYSTSWKNKLFLAYFLLFFFFLMKAKAVQTLSFWRMFPHLCFCLLRSRTQLSAGLLLLYLRLLVHLLYALSVLSKEVWYGGHYDISAWEALRHPF